MKFNIYYEYYSFKQKKTVRRNLGESEGVSFSNACYNLTLINEDFRSNFNFNNLSYRGHELYGDIL